MSILNIDEVLPYLSVTPLYNKLDQDKVLYNFLRGEIYGYIKAKPGEYYNAIMKAL